MESVPDQLPYQQTQLSSEKQLFNAPIVFLPSVIEYQPQRGTAGYDSGYYWEDVQRALRIAAGLETWSA